ncbi:MAG: hypothetical protein ABSH01_19060 [Terriglobia bacterium]|jgi:hypothetical protein
MPYREYILDAAGNPQEAEDTLQWGRWMQTAKRHIGEDQIKESRISTVFLGLDHSFGEGEPVLWETMVFGGPLDGEQNRYTSRQLALEGHAEMCRKVQEAQL